MEIEFLSKKQRADFYIERERRIDIEIVRRAKEPLYFDRFKDKQDVVVCLTSIPPLNFKIKKRRNCYGGLF